MDTDKTRKLDDWLHLIETHAWVAWTKIRKPAEHAMDDLIQEGVTVFLNACNDFSGDRGASFRTFLTGCLRNHFTSLAKQTYQNKLTSQTSSSLQGNRFREEVDSKHRVSAMSTTLEEVQMLFLMRSFSPEELEYITAILACAHISPRSRRKAARQDLNISFEREVKLRNSIRDKIKK